MKELFPEDNKLYEKALVMKEQMTSKSQFRSGIKTRDSSDKKLTQSYFNSKTETGKSKSNFYPGDTRTSMIGLKKNNNFYVHNNLEIVGDNCTNLNVDLGSKNSQSQLIKNENILTRSQMSVSDSIPNKKLTEKEIDKCLQEYRSKLNSELLKILSEEKYKEQEREILYENTIDIIEKKRLEKIISMERAQSSEKILKLNE